MLWRRKEFWFRVLRLVVAGGFRAPALLPGYKWTVDKQGGRFIHRPPVNPKSEEFLHQMKKGPRSKGTAPPEGRFRAVSF